MDGHGDDVAALQQQRAELQVEVKRLVEAIAKGVASETVAADIRERETKIRLLDTRLKLPTEPPDRARLRSALEQRTADSKRDLRGDVRIARLVLRRLLNPITLHDALEYPRERAD